jgi:hypothetical protein
MVAPEAIIGSFVDPPPKIWQSLAPVASSCDAASTPDAMPPATVNEKISICTWLICIFPDAKPRK